MSSMNIDSDMNKKLKDMHKALERGHSFIFFSLLERVRYDLTYLERLYSLALFYGNREILDGLYRMIAQARNIDEDTLMREMIDSMQL